MFRPKKILVPTDFSDYSDRAFLQALDIARQYGSSVELFHVVADDVQQCAVDYCMDNSVVEELKKEILARAQEKISTELARFPEAKDNTLVTAEIGHGKPYQTILQEQRDKGFDLIVLASLGKSGIAHIIIGSVARHILREATCPVLLIK
jgi:nucleotide-binding universal stress UspA family protein